MLRNILYFGLKFAQRILSCLFYFLPVKQNKVLFINFNGKGYGCNPKYIAQEILRQKLDYDLVWLVSDMRMDFPQGIRKVRFDRLRSIYEVATAKIIVTNVKNDLYLVKKKCQYVIQTWHGSYSAKPVEKDAADKLPRRYVKESMKNSAQTDLFLSNSKVLTQAYRDSFWCECEIMECGFPRNDILFSGDRESVSRHVKNALSIPENSHLVLYAPTFRDDGSLDGYSIDSKGILKALEKGTEDWYLLIRLHPNVGDPAGLFLFGGHVINATPYPDMQELLVASDILITDYSSTIFEFAAMGKPSYIFASDVESYQKMRGLKEDFFRMPYPICKNNEQLLSLLSQHTPESGLHAAKEFMAFYGGTDEGRASEQVVQRIRKVIFGL